MTTFHIVEQILNRNSRIEKNRRSTLNIWVYSDDWAHNESINYQYFWKQLQRNKSVAVN